MGVCLVIRLSWVNKYFSNKMPKLKETVHVAVIKYSKSKPPNSLNDETLLMCSYLDEVPTDKEPTDINFLISHSKK